MPTHLALCLYLVSLASVARALPVAEAAQAVAPGPRAVLVDASGASRVLPVADLETLDPRALGATLVRFEGLPAASAGLVPDPAIAEVAGGEVLVGSVRGAQGETLEIVLAGGLPVYVELERLRSLRWPSRLEGAGGVEPAPEGDRLIRVRGGGVERIDGAVEEFTARGVRFHGELVGALDIAWQSVAALFVEHLGDTSSAQPADPVRITVDLDDGSRLAGRLVRLAASGLDLERRGETLRLPLARVLLLAVEDGRTGFLGALAPASAEPSRPFGDDLGMVWPHRVDRAVGGGPLAAGGRRHPRGIGVHAPSRLAWSLDGSLRALRGLVAVDDEALRCVARGSVTFRVLLDGRLAFESPLLRGGDAPLAFAVDLTGAKTLELVADPGPDGFAGDRADWLELVVERAQAGSGADTSRK